MKRIAAVLVVLGTICLYGGTQYESPAKECCPQQVSHASVKKYKATITKKDERSNTRTFTDFCDASSNSEATRIFKERYPNATVSGVREVEE